MSLTRETPGLEIELICEPEDKPVRGYFASGEDRLDRADEQAIIDDLERGNDWAWFRAHVVVTYDGEQAADYLGACSYKNEKDFRNDDYFRDMVDTCIAELNKRINGRIAEIAHELKAVNKYNDGNCKCTDGSHDCDNGGIDVRLQVYDDNRWAIRFGSSDYDQDHRGNWGCSSVPGNGWAFDAEEMARDLWSQAMDMKAQGE